CRPPGSGWGSPPRPGPCRVAGPAGVVRWAYANGCHLPLPARRPRTPLRRLVGDPVAVQRPAAGPRRSRLRRDRPPARRGHRARPARDPFCLVMVESAEALADLDATLAVDGVDGIYVGPNDLSRALGCKLDPD